MLFLRVSGGPRRFASCFFFPSSYRRDVEDAVPYGGTEAGALCGERRVYAAGAVHGRPALSLLLEEKVAFGVSRFAE